MKTLRTAALYGIVMGIYAIASVYVVVSLFPAPFGVAIPIGGLAIAIGVLWPKWFDRRPDSGAARRFLRRLGVIGAAMPVAAVASFLIVLLVPSFISWSENLHRQNLESQGLPGSEIEARLRDHRQVPSHFLMDGAMMAGIPGVIASLVTTGAGAILLRQRPSRP